MALCRYRDVVQDTAGNAISGASVAVVETGTTTPATLYSDLAGNSAIDGGTVLTDSGGLFEFYALPGVYDLTITKTGYPTQTDTEVAVINATTVVDALALLERARVYPTWNGLSLNTAQFRGAADTAASLGTLGLLINADSESAAAVDYEANDVTETSTINGASTLGTWRIVPSASVVTNAYVGQLSMTAPLAIGTASPVLAASKQIMHFDFAEADNVRYVVWMEGPPTNFAGTPGTGSARMVTVYGIAGEAA